MPAPLQPWVDWVIEGAGERAHCTYEHDRDSLAGCAWPSPLSLQLADDGGRFEQQWTVSYPAFVPLPGDAAQWPLEVRVNDVAAQVTDVDGMPALYLAPGEYRVSGSFRYRTLPARLPVPPASAVVRLRINGERVVNPARDPGGVLSLRHGEPPASSDRVEVSVFRLLRDDRPFQVQTRLVLDVSGAERELVLPSPLLAGEVPLRLSGPLPIRLLADGRIQMAVRPGRLEFELLGRLPGPVEAVSRGAVTAPLPPREVWSFQSRPALRDVRPGGLDPVDPRQTRMPDAWRSLPAFVAGADATLALSPGQVTAQDAPRDQLSLERTLWLDFDGGGYTAQDRIAGVVHGDRRLEVDQPMTLGRVALHGEPQFITRLAGSGSHGVEVRPGPLDLVADLRLSERDGSLPASGWNRDLREVATTLQLPPGYRLVSASGADRVDGAWLDRWSMLDMFMVLVLSVAAFRVWGALAGAVALAALALSWHGVGAPQFAWVPLLLASALLHALKPSRLQRAVVLLRGLAILLVVVVATPYLVQTARTVVFPQLEQARLLPPMAGFLPGAASRAQLDEARHYAKAMAPAPVSAPTLALESMAGAAASTPRVVEPPSRAFDTTLVQTGPGVPDWNWNRYTLHFGGPVDADRGVRLVVLGPLANRVLDLARFVLVLAFLGILLVNRRPPAAGDDASGAAGLAAAVAALALLPLLAPEPALADEFPPPALLEELERRLVRPPDCLPHCVNLHSVLVTADDSELRIFYELTVLEEVAAPLLGPSATWSADSVEVDGADGRVRGDDGIARVVLPAGHRLVEVSGPVGDARDIELTFPLRPHRLLVESAQWRSAGMERAGGRDRQLRLFREREAVPAAGSMPASGLVPPFFSLTRTLVLGLDARVRNELVRLSDPRAPLSLDVALLPGETPVSNVTSGNGTVRATFAAGQDRFAWESLLALTSPYRLEAPVDANRVERWQLDAGTRWHVRHEGVSPVLTGGGEGPVKTWYPWPGEVLSLSLERPDGVAGPTLTIDRSRLDLTPGRQGTLASLGVSLRSSQGGNHELTLPAGVDVQQLRVDGQVLPVDPGQRMLRIPLRPGTVEVAVEWRSEAAMDNVYRSPTVDLGAPSVNSTIAVHPDAGRWLLWVHGPALGPAILYWGLLAFVLAASLGLARMTSLPVRWWEWFVLGAGIVHGSLWFALPILAWFVLAERRGRMHEGTGKATFNLAQLALVALTPLMLWALVAAVETGLLGSPDMQVSGNGSGAGNLAWYQDRSESTLAGVSVVSVPMLAYRLLMLAWSLWLAFSVFRWLRWGWQCFSRGGTWRAIRWRPARQASAGKDTGS